MCDVQQPHVFMHACIRVCVTRFNHLFKQEGGGSEGEGPAVMVVEELLRLSGSVHHLVIDAGDIQDQTYHETETCRDIKTHTYCILIILRVLQYTLCESSLPFEHQNIHLVHK